jgi:hypothetical protein
MERRQPLLLNRSADAQVVPQRLSTTISDRQQFLARQRPARPPARAGVVRHDRLSGPEVVVVLT